MLALTLIHYLNGRRDLPLAPDQRAIKRRRRSLCAVVIALIAFVGWLVADYTGRRLDRDMREQVLTRTRLAAAAVMPADVRQLHWDERDLENPSYLKLKALMMALRRANPDLRFVLLAGLKEGRSYFLVDSERPDSPDYSPPGQSYEEAPEEYLAGMAARIAFLNGPATDRWGTWISGSVPIVDENGDCLADMELDIAAADWDALIRAGRLPMLLITLLIGALVAGSYRAIEGLRESSAEIGLSELRNRSLVEGSPDCVQMFDLAGRYLAVNQNGLRALGLPESAVIGKNFADLWPEATRPAIREAVRATVSGQPTSFEADYVHPNGQTVTWRVATNPVSDAAGRVVSFVGICVDLTVRKQAEIAMRAAQRAAEDATQAKSEFLAIMSHEIRTPLAGVIGMLDLLQNSALEPKPRRYTEFARDSADGLLHLLDEVLDAAKFEAGKLTLESIPFRPHDYFTAVLESAAMRAGHKGLTLAHSVTTVVPAVLLGDPTRLRQVVNNLVNNALKFTEKGRVTVTLDSEPGAKTGRVRFKIVVRDSGIGIPEETRTRLFSKFVQADSSTTRRFGGTGLGLSIVKSLAELMGGDVSVESAVGIGSTFTFSAELEIGRDDAVPAKVVTPVATTSAKPAAPARPAAPVKVTRPTASVPVVRPSGPMAPVPASTSPVSSGEVRLRVLIVDDDESNRTVAEALVTSFGHQIAFAQNGREAVDRLIREKFDVVLMDNRMPVMDGFTATRLIRDPATGATDPNIYIIALTANASSDDRAKCLAATMNDFATKPVRGPAMGAALDRAISVLRQRGALASTPKETVAAPAVAGPVADVADAALPAGLSVDELMASLDEDVAQPEVAAKELEMSAETLQKITSIFLRETPRRLVLLRTSLQERDAVAFGIEAHALKGNARYFNARRLNELAARMEILADQNKLDQLAPLLVETEQAFEDLQRQLMAPATA